MAREKQLVVESTIKGFTAKFLSTSEYFDKGSMDGVFAIPSDSKVKYNIRAIDKYCSQHGIKPSELSAEQLKQFEI